MDFLASLKSKKRTTLCTEGLDGTTAVTTSSKRCEGMDSNHRTQISGTTNYQSINIVLEMENPPLGWVKCNFDVAHREGNIPSRLGWIIRGLS